MDARRQAGRWVGKINLAGAGGCVGRQARMRVGRQVGCSGRWAIRVGRVPSCGHDKRRQEGRRDMSRWNDTRDNGRAGMEDNGRTGVSRQGTGGRRSCMHSLNASVRHAFTNPLHVEDSCDPLHIHLDLLKLLLISCSTQHESVSQRVRPNCTCSTQRKAACCRRQEWPVRAPGVLRSPWVTFPAVRESQQRPWYGWEAMCVHVEQVHNTDTQCSYLHRPGWQPSTLSDHACSLA